MRTIAALTAIHSLHNNPLLQPLNWKKTLVWSSFSHPSMFRCYLSTCLVSATLLHGSYESDGWWIRMTVSLLSRETSIYHSERKRCVCGCSLMTWAAAPQKTAVTRCCMRELIQGPLCSSRLLDPNTLSSRWLGVGWCVCCYFCHGVFVRRWIHHLTCVAAFPLELDVTQSNTLSVDMLGQMLGLIRFDGWREVCEYGCCLVFNSFERRNCSDISI